MALERLGIGGQRLLPKQGSGGLHSERPLSQPRRTDVEPERLASGWLTLCGSSPSPLTKAG